MYQHSNTSQETTPVNQLQHITDSTKLSPQSHARTLNEQLQTRWSVKSWQRLRIELRLSVYFDWCASWDLKHRLPSDSKKIPRKRSQRGNSIVRRILDGSRIPESRDLYPLLAKPGFVNLTNPQRILEPAFSCASWIPRIPQLPHESLTNRTIPESTNPSRITRITRIPHDSNNPTKSHEPHESLMNPTNPSRITRIIRIHHESSQIPTNPTNHRIPHESQESLTNPARIPRILRIPDEFFGISRNFT